jgi:hypothetical protein
MELDTGDLLYTRSTKTIPPKTITNHTIERLSQKNACPWSKTSEAI